MQRINFRNHTISRNCIKSFKDYRLYKPYLREDFKHRCAYCNAMDELTSEYYQIDHFIPRVEFENIKHNNRYLSLENDYNNLLYTCPKCNLAKSSQCICNLDNDKYDNYLFYNPIEVNFNDVFYRNKLGSIKSEDAKGKDMIIRLKLYRIVHNLNWLLEQCDAISKNLEAEINTTIDSERKKDLNNLSIFFLSKYRDLHQLICQCYHSC